MVSAANDGMAIKNIVWEKKNKTVTNRRYNVSFFD